MQTILRYDESPRVLTECLFATGRSCIVHLIRKYGPGIAFLPQMYPAGLYDPFKACGVEMVGYRLRDDLEPDLDDLQRCLMHYRHERPLVVIVHYFGYWMPTHVPAALAHQYGGLLFEDCAHCLPIDGRKSCADVALYSFNKFFGVEDGAMMLSCSRTADLSMPNNLDKLPQEAIAAYRDHLAANRIIGNMPVPRTGLEREMLAAVERQSADAYERYYAIISADMEPRRPTRDRYRGDPDAERERRWDNARDLYLRLRAGIKGMLLCRDEGVPLFAFPVLCADRLKTQASLRAAGVLAAFLSDKWRCEPETDFWRKHLLLPLRDPIKP